MLSGGFITMRLLQPLHNTNKKTKPTCKTKKYFFIVEIVLGDWFPVAYFGFVYPAGDIQGQFFYLLQQSDLKLIDIYAIGFHICGRLNIGQMIILLDK